MSSIDEKLKKKRDELLIKVLDIFETKNKEELKQTMEALKLIERWTNERKREKEDRERTKQIVERYKRFFDRYNGRSYGRNS